jgi:hypothetical protein
MQASSWHCKEFVLEVTPPCPWKSLGRGVPSTPHQSLRRSKQPDLGPHAAPLRLSRYPQHVRRSFLAPHVPSPAWAALYPASPTRLNQRPVRVALPAGRADCEQLVFQLPPPKSISASADRRRCRSRWAHVLLPAWLSAGRQPRMQAMLEPAEGWQRLLVRIENKGGDIIDTALGALGRDWVTIG